MMHGNVSPPSRWPLDPLDRLDRAQTDMDFVRQMKRIGFQSAVLNVIYIRAANHRREATEEISTQYGRTD